MTRRTTRLITLLIALLAIVGGALIVVDNIGGRMALMSLLQHGGTIFVPVEKDSSRLSPSMRLALAGHVPAVAAGLFAWRDAGDGVEVAELPVLAGTREVDRIDLARIDLARNRIVVRNDTSGRLIEDWTTRLDARLVINGSYYAASGLPDTPFLEDGRPLGPSSYDARQGALVVSPAATVIHDLAHESWQTAFAAARDALVSYPLLLGPDGKARPVKPSDWLANRSFVGLDRQGRVVFGTTQDAFFSLARLAAFLETAPLDLGATLNLDGGPIACQQVRTAVFARDFCGRWEINDQGGHLAKLTWLYGRFALPVVIAAIPR